MEANRLPLSIVCDNVRSLANVGTIFRVCDAVRAERLFLCGITGYPRLDNDTRPTWVAERAGLMIAKTALETVGTVPWSHRLAASDVVRELKAGGSQIVALEQSPASINYVRAIYRFPVCLVVGHERTGVDDSILQLADFSVEIPMFGSGQSLNVSTALGICAYEIARRSGGISQ